MRSFASLLLISALSVPVAACGQEVAPRAERPSRSDIQADAKRRETEARKAQADREAIRHAFSERMRAPDADPVKHAVASAAAGRFGLVYVGSRSRNAVGLTCFTPWRQPPEVVIEGDTGDVITAEVAAAGRYYAAYNRALVNQPNYPDAELCRPRVEADQAFGWTQLLVDRPAHKVSTPILTLQQAARRGGPKDVERLLRSGAAVDARDSMGMTALAWAVARNNKPAIEALLEAGASPLSRDDERTSPLFWAIALDRKDLVHRFAVQPGQWPRSFLEPASATKDADLVALVLSRLGSNQTPVYWTKPLPTLAVARTVLAHEGPASATRMLPVAVDEGRIDLVRLAIGNGANLKTSGRETPLGLAAQGFTPSAPEILDLLVGSGADVNQISDRRRPIWIVVGVMKSSEHDHGVDRTRRRMFDRLMAAGADINLPNYQGRPPIWALLFPYSSSHEELDASYVTPELLEMLTRNGLDLNATQEGKRVLPLVEAQAGKNSELAHALRQLGARS